MLTPETFVYTEPYNDDVKVKVEPVYVWKALAIILLNIIGWGAMITSVILLTYFTITNQIDKGNVLLSISVAFASYPFIIGAAFLHAPKK